MATGRLDKLKRLFLAREEGWSSQELANEFGVSQRVIQRDLESLQSEPHRLPLVREGWRWRLMEGHLYELPPVVLSIHQAVALYLAGRLLARYSDEHNPHVVAALTQLGSILPHVAARQVEQSAQSLKYRHTRAEMIRAWEALAEGWLQQQKVRVQYYGAEELMGAEIRETVVSPYLLEPSSWGLATYVIGYSSAHAEVRTFKVERVKEAELLDERFEIPVGLNLPEMLTTAWNVMYGEKTERVALRFSPSVTWRVRESEWHPSQRIEDLPDGGCRLTFQIAFPFEMKPWIRQWGSEVVVEEPSWMREELDSS